MTLIDPLRGLFEPVLRELTGQSDKLADYLAMIKPASNPEHGDYQANFAMPLAKVLGKKPVDLARELISRLPANDWIANATVAGPGFINIRLADDALSASVRKLSADARLGIHPVAQPKTFVIDLSGPNVAKPLHVGHLRSTIIGDSLVRILRFLGHNVTGDNHLGDWGTQFGILIYGYKHHLDPDAFQKDSVRELARLYVHVRSLFLQKGDDDDDAPVDDPIKEACRLETAKLHAGDPENVALWKQFMPACLEMLRPIYDRLDVKIDFALGESYYNPMLPGVVEDLLSKGIAVESNGAVVVPNAKGVIPKPGETKEEPPALIRKRDGAFTYTTTDLATVQYRVQTWNPDVMLYVVDARQALHFKTLFANARRWGYDRVRYEHVSFGSILGPDRKPLRTRDGGVQELLPLLDEAVEIAARKYQASIAERKASGREVPEHSEEMQKLIAEVVGVGAVKYADLSQNRTSDYVFDADKMTSQDGNTSTYMQYAYARCRSILRNGQVDDQRLQQDPPRVILSTPQERNLALQLLRFGEALQASASEFMPHLLTGYLWDLAKATSQFYEVCPVLKADTPEERESRFVLVNLVGRVIQHTLQLLGIRTVEQM